MDGGTGCGQRRSRGRMGSHPRASETTLVPGLAEFLSDHGIIETLT